MNIGDYVVRKSYGKDITFKIIGIRDNQDSVQYILKGVNLRIEADSPVDDLELVTDQFLGKMDRVFNENANESIRKVLQQRKNEKKSVEVYKELIKNHNNSRKSKNSSRSTNKNKKANKNDGEYLDKEMIFGRPGRVLHIDGDEEYLEACLKTYKELSIDAVGRKVLEKDQPNVVVELVKEIRPDIIVITGHDGIIKNADNYIDLENYRNSKYFVQAVMELRKYEPNYDDLVIFAGACQSCYEAILDAGANFASSPSRVLIHCLDPVMVCEKISYTNISEIVSIKEVLDNTITGIKGIGGIQTRGKYREGFPKSVYIK